MLQQGGISEVQLAAMIEGGALTSSAAVPAADWLTSPPDHVRSHDWSCEPGNLRAPPAPSQTRLLTIEQIMAAPSTAYIVRGVLPAMGLVALFGPPGSGKSFLAIDLVLSIASGQSSWFGKRLEKAPVAYLALEGRAGIARRLRAWLTHHGIAAPANVRFFTDTLSLLNKTDADVVAQEIKRDLGSGTVTVIDTLSRASPGGDENSSIDMTKVIENAQLIGQVAAGPVILVHHTGKDAGKGLRGHSSLIGAVDSAIEVVNLNGGRSWRITKAKEDEAGIEFPFELVPYTVGTDQWGDEVRSCAVRPSLGPPPRLLPRLSGKNQIAVVAAIREELSTSAAVPIGWTRALELAAAALSTTPIGRRKSVAKDTLERLIKSGHIQFSEGLLCLS